jgi:hypothetical protein
MSDGYRYFLLWSFWPHFSTYSPKCMESCRLSRRGAWTQRSVFTDLGVKGRMIGIWDGLLEWQEMCRLNEITDDTSLCFLKWKGDTAYLWGHEKQGDRQVQLHSLKVPETQYYNTRIAVDRRQSWSETELWFVLTVRLLQELDTLSILLFILSLHSSVSFLFLYPSFQTCLM